MTEVHTGTTIGQPGRKAEAMALAIAGFAMLWLIASATNVGGYMTHLDALGPVYRALYVGLFAVACCIAAAAVWMAARGRRGAGVLTMAGVLTIYGALLNAGPIPGNGLVPMRLAEVNQRYSLILQDADVPGAELWINGTMVGTLPLQTTLGELRQKVPVWTAPPADLESDTAVVWEQSAYPVNKPHWGKFDLPQIYRPSARLSPTTTPSGTAQTCYARIRYGGEWACFTGGGGSGTSAGGMSAFSYTMLSVRFPQREQRLRELLNQLRLRDYRVDEAWAKALDSYGSDGWIAVQKRIASEPEMQQVFDALARRQGGLSVSLDAAAAAALLKGICAKADQRRWYRTDDLTGRTVELLCSQLPLDPLIADAQSLVHGPTYVNYCTWKANGQTQFGTFQHAEAFSIDGAEGSVTSIGFGAYGVQLPPRAFVIAHALRTIAADPSPRGQACRDRIAREITPQLLRYHTRFLQPTLAAAILSYGAPPEVARSFERRYWKTRDSRDWEDQISGGGDSPNRWLYCLAVLNSPEAAEFRRRNPDAMMGLADTLIAHHSSLMPPMNQRIEFLFENPAVALSYWPRFLANGPRNSWEPDELQVAWKYLNRLGEAATPEMYADAFVQVVPGRGEMNDALRLLVSLPEAKQQQILDAITRRLSQGNANVNRDFEDGAKGLLKYLPQQVQVIKDARVPGYEERQRATYDLRDLRESNTPALMERIRGYLAEGSPQSPLAEMLAAEKRPELRKLALVGIRRYSTPARRQLLQQLQGDPDASVRQAADAVAAELQGLAGHDARE